MRPPPPYGTPLPQVIIFDDDVEEEVPSDGSDLSCEDYETESAEEDDSDDDDDGSDEEGLLESNSGDEKSDNGLDGNISESDNEDEGNSKAGRLRKRKRGSKEKDAAKVESRAKRDRKDRLHRYYKSTFHGTPAAKQMYELAQQMNKDRNDTLWLCILGMTDLYIHQKIDSARYRQHVEDLADEVGRKNIDQAASYTTSDGAIVAVQETGKIHYEPSCLRLMLLQHWSLYESMFHSDFTAARLETWKARGREKLEEMLAKMGLSLKEAKQKFEFMSQPSQTQLMRKLHEHKESYGLEEIFYPSFSRSHGFNKKMSASDVVYSVTALLEHAVENPDAKAAEDRARSNHDNDENDGNGQNGENGNGQVGRTANHRYTTGFDFASHSLSLI
jgi:cell division control protein 45